MAKVISNSYTGNEAGNPDFTSGKTRTNPQAHAVNNLVKLYGMRKFGDCQFDPTWVYDVAAGGATATFTPSAGQATTGLRYWKYRIIDQDGTEVVGAMNLGSPNADIVINTSTLDPRKTWNVEFKAETRVSGKSCFSEWWLEIPSATITAGVTNASGQNV